MRDIHPWVQIEGPSSDKPQGLAPSCGSSAASQGGTGQEDLTLPWARGEMASPKEAGFLLKEVSPVSAGTRGAASPGNVRAYSPHQRKAEHKGLSPAQLVSGLPLPPTLLRSDPHPPSRGRAGQAPAAPRTKAPVAPERPAHSPRPSSSHLLCFVIQPSKMVFPSLG